jgi:hypothetical protein
MAKKNPPLPPPNKMNDLLDLPDIYVTPEYGVSNDPIKYYTGENAIVFTAWYHLGRDIKGVFNLKDTEAMNIFLEASKDEHGLYARKNSHDNITYKMLLSKHFNLGLEDEMSSLEAIKSVGLRVWDMILYFRFFGPKYLRWLAMPLMFIPALQAIHSAYVQGKIRPAWERRWWWWHFPKKEIKREYIRNFHCITWENFKGEHHRLCYYQNDGKHLSLFKSFVLKKFSLSFWIASKIIKKIYLDRYGEDYGYVILHNYFGAVYRPVTDMYREHGDFL